MPGLFKYLRTLIKLFLPLKSSILWAKTPNSFNLFLPLGFADFWLFPCSLWILSNELTSYKEGTAQNRFQCSSWCLISIEWSRITSCVLSAVFLFVCPRLAIIFIFPFYTAFQTHVHTCDPLQAARFYSEEVFPRHLLTSADDLVVFFTNKQCWNDTTKGQISPGWNLDAEI